MVQVLKEGVRRDILDAAAAVFAETGFAPARLSDIAACAGTSTSNLYKYAKDKADLFDQVVSPALAARYADILETRVGEFAQRSDWEAMTASGSDPARELLGFWVSHRHVAVILMSRGAGTPYADLRHRLVAMMTDRAMQIPGGGRQSPEVRFLLDQIFTRTLDTLSEILLAYSTAEEIAAMVALFWRYQLAGLEALLAPPNDLI